MTSALQIGSRRELFVDRALVDRLEGAWLQLHHPQPQEVALACELPWELGELGAGLPTGPSYPTVFADDGGYRLYYNVRPPGGCEDNDERQMTCYAESDDGIHWRKPALGLFAFNGSCQNNIVWRGAISHNLTPFRDDNPACPPDERYKAVGGVQWGAGGLWALASPDGLRWRKLLETPLPLPGNFDSQNVAFWDTAAGLYRAFWRGGSPGQRPGRDCMSATSHDFRDWSAPAILDYAPGRSGSPELDLGDDPSGDHHQFYTNGVLPYARAPHLLLGFPQRYSDRGWTASTEALPDRALRRELADRGIGGGRPTRLGTALTDVLFMASRDGRQFAVWPEAFVRPGIQRPGNWYYGDAWYCWGLVETASRYPGAPPELSLYLQERMDRHAPGQLRRHTLRLDGFASVHAPLTGGTLVTRPLRFTGHRLELNFATSAGGTLRV